MGDGSKRGRRRAASANGDASRRPGVAGEPAPADGEFARKPPPYLRAALQAAEAARAKAAEVRARSHGLSAEVGAKGEIPEPKRTLASSSTTPAVSAAQRDEAPRAGNDPGERRTAAIPARAQPSWQGQDASALPSDEPGAYGLAEDASTGWSEAEDEGPAATREAAKGAPGLRLKPRARRLVSALGRYPRLRLALFCGLGLLGGGVVGASLGALHFLFLGQEPPGLEATAPEAPLARQGEAAPDAAGLEAQSPAQRQPGSGRETVSLMPPSKAEVAEDTTTPASETDPGSSADSGQAPARPSVTGTAGGEAVPEQPTVAEATPAAPTAPEDVPLIQAVRALEPAARPQAPELVPDGPGPEANLAGAPFPLPPPAAPRGIGPAPERPVMPGSEPEAWGDLYRLAHRLQDQDRLEEAIAAFERATAADGSHAATFYDWGYALQQAGQPDAAIEKYRRTLELDPGHAYAHYNLGYLLQQEGELAAAAASYRKAATLDSGNPYVFYNWGEILRQHGDIQGALGLYRRASQLTPGRQPGVDAQARLDQLGNDRPG